MIRHLICSIAAMALCLPTLAQAGPPAQLSDLGWLVGQWEGEGIGGAPAVEVYSTVAGGQLPGHFRQLNPDGTVQFYELIVIAERDGSLVYRLKHFGPDLVGWEDQTTVREFPLSAVEENRWEFSGLTYQRLGPDRMTVSVVVAGQNGANETLVFHFRRR